MVEVCKWDKSMWSIILMLSILPFTNCQSSKPQERPSYEQAKFILQLEHTRLLVSEVVRELDEPWEITWGPDEHLWFTEKSQFLI